ncbi:hypothetical protein FGU46_10300 [Methanobacterium sp. CWC-01]|uniref:hypothetical protein n=1 Tax=Methanobacterium aridiramus TaxID=2584467 RepID=UPI0025778056|nr:hypothetical protein [Methanobacterium sp. CWC-01]WJI10450.1 hypothetical protein FGU46_10300 [Methanobacterium sp. CWC-01]
MKKISAIVGILLLIGIVVAVSGCTSDDSSVDDESSIATKNYDGETGVTSGYTKDGNAYAYDEEGNMAISDGEDTYYYDQDTEKVYQVE